MHLLVYVTVAVTVASGAEYFWAAARGLNGEDGPGASGGAGGVEVDSGGSVEPGSPAGVAH